jgi:hypothetical protein
MDRETLEFDVVFVGAGPANLSGALHLARLVKEHNASGEAAGKPLGEIEIAVIEKGAAVGSHILSGADSKFRGRRRSTRITCQRGLVSLPNDETCYTFTDNPASS